MGTYLSTPVLEKHTENGADLDDSDTPVRWAVVDMQGWRKSMEDAHVARTDVPPPKCYTCQGGDDGGGGGENNSNDSGEGSATEGEAAANNDSGASAIATSSPLGSSAKVFAVFDGHGGAEVARFCQMHLVPVLTGHDYWTTTTGREDSGSRSEWAGKNLAYCVGRALIESFHALDTLIDDPSSREEIEMWRSQVPPPYVHKAAGKVEVVVEEEGGSDEKSLEINAESQPSGEEEAQQRRHTVMDPSEIAVDAAKLQSLEDGEDEEEESNDNTGGGDVENTSNKKGEMAKEGGDVKNITPVPNGMSHSSNPSDMLDGDEDEVFQDSLSEHPDEDDDLENKEADGAVHDDSDDEEENTGENEGEGSDSKAKTGDGKEAGTMVLSASDAVALFQKLLHMNGPADAAAADDEDVDGLAPSAVVNGEKMNGKSGNAEGESDGGAGGEATGADAAAVPTREQLLNPPTGTGPPSASVPTRIVSGRKVCNLPDHPVHAGCTSVVAVMVGKTLVVANAGDSRAVICRTGGRTEPLSFDHKPLQNREMNRITNAGGFVNQFGRVNGNLNLSRSIGDLKYKQVPGIPPSEQMITAEPDILSTTLNSGDEFIILGCDGIWDCLSNEECVKYVRDRIDSKHPREIGMEMLDDIVSADPRASQGIGGDNMTIMIVDLMPHSRPYNDG